MAQRDYIMMIENFWSKQVQKRQPRQWFPNKIPNWQIPHSLEE